MDTNGVTPPVTPPMKKHGFEVVLTERSQMERCKKNPFLGQIVGKVTHCSILGKDLNLEDVHNKICRTERSSKLSSYGQPDDEATHFVTHGKALGYKDVVSQRANRMDVTSN